MQLILLVPKKSVDAPMLDAAAKIAKPVKPFVI